MSRLRKPISKSTSYTCQEVTLLLASLKANNTEQVVPTPPFPLGMQTILPRSFLPS